VKQYSLSVRIIFVFCIIVSILASCKKVNEATELGGDLIPAVDNITTFDTILEVQSFNYLMPMQLDSSRSAASDIQYLGAISNDPQFGKSSGTMFLQLKPSVYRKPFAFADPASIVALDSVVLVLGYRTIYGDSLLPQQAQVFEIDQTSDFKADSAYMISSNAFTYATPLSGTKTILPATLNDSVVLFREAAANQLRIRLDDAFGNRLLRYDSSNAYASDSAFNKTFKGFAVVPGTNNGGNALMGFSLADTNTKLAVYYKYTNGGKTDTAVTYFRFNQTSSAAANYIQRDYSGSALAAATGDAVADPMVYIQNAPGTYARLLVPGLSGLTNRVVHRAELMVQQIKDPAANTFGLPPNMYLDAFDAAASVYRSLPFDVSITAAGQINTAAFGMLPVLATDPSGNAIAQWRFNISRYVQRVANGTVPAYEFRLFSPFIARTNIGTSATQQTFQVNATYAVGRVVVGGGNHPTQPMRVRIIYSKL
jgi:hypothetical protein